MSILEQIGRRIKSLRESKGLSLAEVCKRSRISTSFISQLENSNTDVSLGRLEALAGALGIPLPDLVNEKLSTEHIISSAALDAFCEQDKISAPEKAYLKELLDKGVASFSTPKDWRSHYRAWKFERARRPTLAELPRVAEIPQTYRAQGKPRGSHREKSR